MYIYIILYILIYIYMIYVYIYIILYIYILYIYIIYISIVVNIQEPLLFGFTTELPWGSLGFASEMCGRLLALMAQWSRRGLSEVSQSHGGAHEKHPFRPNYRIEMYGNKHGDLMKTHHSIPLLQRYNLTM